jgi:hypothetical protein
LQKTANDLEQEIYLQLEAAGKIGNTELDTDLQLNNIHTKSWHVRKAAEAAEIAGWPRREIAIRLLDIVEKHGYNISKAQIYRVCSPMGYSNTDETESHGETKNSSYNPIFEQENAALIEISEKWINFWRSLQVRCRKEHFISLIPKDIAEEGLFLLDRAAENNNSDMDGRQDVSERFFPLMVKASIAGGDKATELYIKYVKEWTPLSGKQYTKLMHGRAVICHPFYDPKNADEAFEIGFYSGRPCESWVCQSCKVGYHTKETPKECTNEIIRRNEFKEIVSKRPCGGTEFKQCHSLRVGPSPEATEYMLWKCHNCKTEFRGHTEKLPVATGVVIDAEFITSNSKVEHSENVGTF